MVKPLIGLGIGLSKKALDSFIKKNKKKVLKQEKKKEAQIKKQEELQKQRKKELYRRYKEGRFGMSSKELNKLDRESSSKQELVKSRIEGRPPKRNIPGDDGSFANKAGGKVKYNVGGIVNPSFGTDFDDR